MLQVITLGGDGTVLWTCGLFRAGAVPPLVPLAMGSLGAAPLLSVPLHCCVAAFASLSFRSAVHNQPDSRLCSSS